MIAGPECAGGCTAISSRRTPVIRAACFLAALWIGADSAQAETIAQLVSREKGVLLPPTIVEDDSPLSPDETRANADWPKRTPDTHAR